MEIKETEFEVYGDDETQVESLQLRYLSSSNRDERLDFSPVDRYNPVPHEVAPSSQPYNLGYILLKIMESAPFLENASIDYLEKIETECFTSTDDKVLYELFLKTEYKKEHTFNGLLFIFKYIVFCTNHREFYNLKCLTRVSGAAQHSFNLPHIAPMNAEEWYESIPDKNIDYSKYFKGLFYNHNPIVYYGYSYIINDLRQLCLSSLYQLISLGGHINRCKYCDKWFIGYSKNEGYCKDSCKVAGRKKSVKTNRSKIISRLLASFRQMYDTSGDAEGKRKFNDEVKEWQKKVKKDDDEKTFEKAYIEWLISHYKSDKKKEEMRKTWLT